MANQLVEKPLDILIRDLKTAFAQETLDVQNVKHILGGYVESGQTDWQECRNFCKIKYSRNLIELNEDFELILLCWLPGQESPIHNHSVRTSDNVFTCTDDV